MREPRGGAPAKRVPSVVMAAGAETALATGARLRAVAP